MIPKEIQDQVAREMERRNNRPIRDFEGYSPNEMHQILYFTLEDSSPIQLKKLSDSDYDRIPLLKQIKYVANLIEEAGELKLTKKGFLPTKVVADIYEQGILKDEHIESGISKLYKEADSMTINLTKNLIEVSGLTKKRHGKLSLTKSSRKVLKDDEELLRLIFKTFTQKFNWAYYDRYQEEQIGRFGYGFTLILLSKYGKEKRLDSFYAGKYFQAYPNLLDVIQPTYKPRKEYGTDCYSIRTFDRFLDYFGLIHIQKEGKGFDADKYITKTDLFDKLIEVRPNK